MSGERAATRRIAGATLTGAAPTATDTSVAASGTTGAVEPVGALAAASSAVRDSVPVLIVSDAGDDPGCGAALAPSAGDASITRRTCVALIGVAGS
jgi:hypothetical protein